MTTTTQPVAPTITRKRERRRYEFILKAEEPISHHERVDGNIASFFRQPVIFMGGIEELPYITAATMRHLIREASAYATFDAAGVLDDPNLSEAALRLSFSGGNLTGRGDASTIKLDAYRELVDVIPALALLGGCTDAQMVPGKTVVEDALLICEESVDYVAPWAARHAAALLGRVDGRLMTNASLMHMVQRVAMDPLLDPAKVGLLSPGARAKVEQRMLAREAAHTNDDAVEKKKNKVRMMPYNYEQAIRGSLFFWAVEAMCHTDLDADTLDTMVWTAMANARVGGKKGEGNGLLRPIALQEIRNNRPFGPVRVSMRLLGDARADVEIEDRAPPGELFRAHVASRADKVREFLSRVDA